MSRNKKQSRTDRLVRRALRCGELERPNRCENCGIVTSFIEGHHEDYDKPLDIIWLCRPCHRSLDVPRGSEHYRSKLKEEDVISIRLRYQEGEISQYDLALEYEVNQSVISEILSRKAWKHV